CLDAIRQQLVDVADGTYWHTNKKFRGTPADRGAIVEMAEASTQASERKGSAGKLPMAGGSQGGVARARALWLERLVRHLTSGSGDEAVRGIVADNNKDTALNKLDHQVLEKLRGTGVISRQVGFAHGRMGDEPLLWEAAGVRWACQRTRA